MDRTVQGRVLIRAALLVGLTGIAADRTQAQSNVLDSATLSAVPAGPRGQAWPTTQSSFQTHEPSLGRAVLSSLIVPGAGQWIQGQKRWALYLAVEATAVLFTVERRGAGSDFRDSYRDLAWTAARDGTAVGRIDPDFPYYESLVNYASSGGFDLNPDLAGVQPETDPTTYNGRIWGLARGIFLGGIADPTTADAGYAQALEYYLERSYDERFLWDWEDRLVERTEYRRLIRESDEAYRTATVLLGVSVANHLVSAIDAFLSRRGTQASLSRHLEFGASPQPSAFGSPTTTWQLHLRIQR